MASTPMEQHNIAFDVDFIMRTFLIPDGAEMSYNFTHATEHPPITSESLAELDMPRIINNPKLRHDVNFDRDLHFRPNLEGSKGKEKMRLAQEFWKALEAELFMYGFVYKRMSEPHPVEKKAYWMDMLRFCRKRLPNVFIALRDILKTLVPDYDQQSVIDRLDVDLLIQEVENGVCNLEDLADWLGKVLKKHCAPMRDDRVDRMKTEIKQGAWEERPSTLVNGIRHLLNILEAMKLDVANHQIRHMRPLLVEDTVNFQRRYNAHRISLNKIDVPGSRLWLEYEMEYLANDNPNVSHVEALSSALLRGVIFNESSDTHPQTFYLDSERLRNLRAELHTSIYTEVCCDAFSELAANSVPPNRIIQSIAELRTRIASIVGNTAKFGERLEYIAVEIMRLQLQLEGSPLQSEQVLLNHIELRLGSDLWTGSGTFEHHATALFERLLPQLQRNIELHLRLNPVQLQGYFVPYLPGHIPTPQPGMGAILPLPNPNPPPYNFDHDIMHRLTHVIALHWQVWAELVYLTDPEDYPDTDDSNDAPTPPSDCVSPTVPVAQAVYAPGKKWIPIAITITEVPSGFPTPSPSPAPQSSDSQSMTPKSKRQQEDSDGSSEQSPVDKQEEQPA